MASVEMGLKPLVFTLDNGFISEGAKANIHRLVDALDLEQRKRIKCACWGLPLESEDIDKALKYYHWQVINSDSGIVFCPNCDVTVVE